MPGIRLLVFRYNLKFLGVFINCVYEPFIHEPRIVAGERNIRPGFEIGRRNLKCER